MSNLVVDIYWHIIWFRSMTLV